MSSGDDGTKIIYHIDEEDTPYLIKLAIPSEKVTLKDFRDALQKPNYKYFFKSMDADFGVVKEEIADDDKHLPSFNGRVVSWLVTADSSDTQSQQGTDSVKTGDMTATLPPERLAGIGDSRPPSFHAKGGSSIVSNDDNLESEALDTLTEVDSRFTSVSARDRHRKDRRRLKNRGQPMNKFRHYDMGSSTVTSSDLESSSFFSEDDCSSRYSGITGETASSYYGGRRQRRPRKTRHHMGGGGMMGPGGMRHAESFSSVTDSTMSYDVITVVLNMDKVSFLGISIVGQSNKGGDGGIYVGSIMKGGAVALDGRIEPGDMILEVNDVSFENMTNDDAVQTLRAAVQTPGKPVSLVVAKCWDPSPHAGGPGGNPGFFTIPRQEPVRPIDPSAWVAHTTALQQSAAAAAAARMDQQGHAGTMGGVSGLDSLGRGVMGTMPGAPGMMMGRGAIDTISESSTMSEATVTGAMMKYDAAGRLHLTSESPMELVVKAMLAPDSSLEIRDRLWLKITIPQSFIGAELVDWLLTHIDGFVDRRDARKYSCNLLRNGYIVHTVNKPSFSEQCYYQFSKAARAVGGMPSVAAPKTPAGGANVAGATADMSCMSLYDSQGSPSEVSSPGGSHLSLPPPTVGSFQPYHQQLQRHGSGAMEGATGATVPTPTPGGPQGAYYATPNAPPPPSSLDYVPPPSYSYVNGAHSYQGMGRMGPGSQRSGSGSSASSETRGQGARSSPLNSGSEMGSVISMRRGRPTGVSETGCDASDTQSLPPPPGELANMPIDVGASKQSFKAAMGNPCELFVDVM